MKDEFPSIKLANLMCSRLCHDLISPVGAINSALELLQEEPGGNVGSDVLPLMMRSVNEASARLAFFRTVFGYGGGPEVELSLSQLMELAMCILPTDKIKVNWETSSFDVLSHQTAKILLILLLTGVESLPRGGQIGITLQSIDGGIGLACVATGLGANLRDHVSTALLGAAEMDSISAKNVAAYYANCLVQSESGSLEAGGEEGRVTLAAFLP